MTQLRPHERRWVDDLTGHGVQFERTCDELHAILLRFATTEMRRRATVLRLAGPEADDIACQAASDALLLVIAKVSEFRGESKFTTWACRFAAFEVRAKLRQHAWWHYWPADFTEWCDDCPESGPGPAALAEARDLAQAMTRMIRTRFSSVQRHVFAGVVVTEDSPSAIAADLEMSANAVYQALFRARRSLHAALAAKGYLTLARTT